MSNIKLKNNSYQSLNRNQIKKTIHINLWMGVHSSSHAVVFYKIHPNWENSFLLCMLLCAGLSSQGVPGVPWHPRILAHQVTLSQSGGKIMPPHQYWHPRIFRPSDGYDVSWRDIQISMAYGRSQSFWPFYDSARYRVFTIETRKLKTTTVRAPL